MELDQLRTFLAVLEHRSFSHAARALHIGQSTVSFHIKALESSVGARLCDRGAGGVRATPTGRALRPYAARIIALRDEALARLRAEEQGEAGRVAVAASTIPAEYLLPEALVGFRQAHPRVEVVVEVSDSGRALAALLARECDLALVGSRLKDRRISYAPFADDEIVLVGAPGTPLAPDGRLTPAELSRVPMVVREEGSGTRDTIAPLLAAARATGAPAAVQVGSTEAVKRCVRRGVGLGFVSRFAVEEELQARRLQVIKLAGTPVKRQFHVATLRGVTLPTGARALRDLLLRKHR